MGIRILIADDHVILRQGIRLLIESDPEMEIVGEANDGREAIDLVRKLTPDILVLDLMMPGMNGLEVIQEIKKRRPEIKIVVLSMHSKEGYVLEALRNGAMAYVLKESSSQELLSAIRAVSAGHYYLCYPFNEKAIAAYIQKAGGSAVDLYDTLTPREREILKLTAQGFTSTEIGSRLNISPRTAEVHRFNMMHKLNLNSQAEVALFAIQRGVLQPDEI
jgi:two-component system, NarL family, response regulator NreC